MALPKTHVYEPESYNAALFFALLAAFFWGTWSNVVKRKGYPFPYMQLDLSLGVCLFALLVFFLPGVGDGEFYSIADLNPFRNGSSVFNEDTMSALASGAVFNLANILLMIGIRTAGLAFAFPCGIGVALVAGTGLLYYQNQRGDPDWLGAGTSLAFLAVMAVAYASYLRDRRSGGILGTSLLAPRPSRTMRFRIGVCSVAGIIMSCWMPLLTEAQGMGRLTAFSALLVFSFGMVLSSLVFGLVLTRLNDTHDGARSMTAWTSRACGSHVPGILAGVCWGMGTLSSTISGPQLGYATSYALGQAAPAVAMMWGIFYFKEFRGAPESAWFVLLVMTALFAGAIYCLSQTHAA
jgi:glucose uptake protein